MEPIIIKRRYADGGVYITQEIFVPQSVVDSQIADAENIKAQAEKAQETIDQLSIVKAQIVPLESEELAVETET